MIRSLWASIVECIVEDTEISAPFLDESRWVPCGS
jgi:hypothetical protein